MDGLRRHFLASAALSQQKDRGIRRGHLADHVKQAAHGGAGAKHSLKEVRARLPLHFADLQFQLRHMENTFEHDYQFFHLHRLGHEVVGPTPDGAPAYPLFSLSGDDDDFDQALQGGQFRQRGQPLLGVGGLRRKAQIQQHDRGTVCHKGLHRAGPVRGQDNFIVAGQGPFHLGADFLVVVNNKQFRFGRHYFRTGRSTRKVVPWLNRLSTSILPPCASTIILL